MLVGFAVALLPREELAAGNTDPLNESAFSELGFGCPIANEVDDLIARVVWNPTAAQGSQCSLFRATYSSDISAMMLSFLTNLASSWAILSSSSVSRLGRARSAGNHYDSRSEQGTKVAALMYSLLDSAELAGVDPATYVEAAVQAGLDGDVIPLPHELAEEHHAAS